MARTICSWVPYSFGSLAGPKIAGPNVEANSSSWISAEGQGLRMRGTAHTALAHSGLGRGKGRAARLLCRMSRRGRVSKQGREQQAK